MVVIYSGIFIVEDDYFVVNFMVVFKGYVSEKFDIDVYIFICFFMVWQFEVVVFGGFCFYKDGIVVFVQNFMYVGNVGVEMGMNVYIEYVVYFFVQYFFGQVKSGNLGVYYIVVFVLFVVEVDFVVEWSEVMSNGQ